MGAKTFEDVCSLANESDYIITCVTNFESLKDVFFNRKGVIHSNNEQLIIADCSTIGPGSIHILFKIIKGKKRYNNVKCARNGWSF